MMHQFAPLPLAQHVGQPVGGGGIGADFVARWRMRRAPMPSSARGDGIDGFGRPALIGRATERAPAPAITPAANGQHDRRQDREPAKRAQLSQESRRSGPTRAASGSRAGRNQPFGNRELPHVILGRAAARGCRRSGLPAPAAGQSAFVAAALVNRGFRVR